MKKDNWERRNKEGKGIESRLTQRVERGRERTRRKGKGRIAKRSRIKEGKKKEDGIEKR